VSVKLPVLISLMTSVIAFGGQAARAQEGARTVADYVYSNAQAERGAGAYETACANCHRTDLGGNTGPPLREQRFARAFAGKDLKTLYTKVATTMPRNAPASLADGVYLDIVAYVLRENGFPAGPNELTTDALDSIRVVPGGPKAPVPVGDFSFVEVVGCLNAGAQNTWTLKQASEPIAVSPSSAGSVLAADATDKSLGTKTFHLIDAMAYAPENHKGQKMSVRGLLIKLPDEQRITISSFEVVSPTCRE
jgi:mono/diheme cytochrome c family protein